MTNYQSARQALGARLKELRADAGMSGRDLADALTWQASKVSKIERGKQTPTRDDLRAWATGIGRPEVETELINRVRTLESHYAAWRRQLAAGHRARQEAWGADERSSTEVLNLETGLMPGLLQTPDYARHMLAEISDLYQSPADIEDGVSARMQRQQLLYEPGHSFGILVWEAVLHSAVAPPDVMAGQLDRLSGAVGLANLTFGVIPFGVQLPPMFHGFWMFDRKAVRVETAAAELRIIDNAEVDIYTRLWDRLSGLAAYGAKAHRIIARVRSTLPDA